MNDVVKSLVAITLLAMLGGFAVAVTNRIVPASHREAAVDGTHSPVRASQADALPKSTSPRDSASVKGAQ